jgi:peroxiredoxin
VLARFNTDECKSTFIHLLKIVSMNITTALAAFSVLITDTPPRTLAGQGTTDLGVKPEGMLTVQVQTSEGKPVTNVTVVCIGQETNAVLKDTVIEGGGERLWTDLQGRFTMKTNGENIAIMIAGDRGFCLAQSRDLTNHSVLVVQPWGRIAGVRTDHNRPLPNHRLSLQIIGRCVDLLIAGRIDISNETSTDSRGRFVFEHVPPIEVWLQDVQAWLGTATDLHQTMRCRLQEVDIQPGEMKKVEIATQGRTVIGRIELGEGSDGVIDLESLDRLLGRGLSVDGLPKRSWVPAEFDTADQRAKWYRDYYNDTEVGRQYISAISKSREVMIHTDGSFILELVEPGKYVLGGNLVRGENASLDPIHFVVPPAATGSDDAPFDIGKTTLRFGANLKVGDAAPDFTAQTLDAHSIKLSDFQGKYVLLDFWATWCVPCVAETPDLKATHDTFGRDKRFVMISLSTDSDREALSKFVKAKNLAWTQVFLGGDSPKDMVAKNYGVTLIPQIMLIGPDGKIIARDLRGPKIKAVVASALAKR